jgi:hypothetical protein
MVLGAAALALSGVLTGIDLRTARTRAELVPVRDKAPVTS